MFFFEFLLLRALYFTWAVLRVVCPACPDWKCSSICFHLVLRHFLTDGKRWKRHWKAEGKKNILKNPVQSWTERISLFLQCGLNSLKTNRCFHLMIQFWWPSVLLCEDSSTPTSSASTSIGGSILRVKSVWTYWQVTSAYSYWWVEI